MDSVTPNRSLGSALVFSSTVTTSSSSSIKSTPISVPGAKPRNNNKRAAQSNSSIAPSEGTPEDPACDPQIESQPIFSLELNGTTCKLSENVDENTYKCLGYNILPLDPEAPYRRKITSGDLSCSSVRQQLSQDVPKYHPVRYERTSSSINQSSQVSVHNRAILSSLITPSTPIIRPQVDEFEFEDISPL